MHFPTFLPPLILLSPLTLALPAEQTINLEQAAATNHDKSAAHTPLPQLSGSKVLTTSDTTAKQNALKILAGCKNDSCSGGKDDAGKECTAECVGPAFLSYFASECLDEKRETG